MILGNMAQLTRELAVPRRCWSSTLQNYPCNLDQASCGWSYPLVTAAGLASACLAAVVVGTTVSGDDLLGSRANTWEALRWWSSMTSDTSSMAGSG
ncbi:hypothetical protein ACH5RR_001485 [Cinchona calisaya]|uniref:Uncharacterized protein n=1 Tax=Cinchona calisaya TaxID=153742 RepID=A0ABD3B3U3_9GENT